MITGFDHVVIAARDIAASAENYQALLGVPATFREADGMTLAVLATANLNVELITPRGAGAAADRVRAALDAGEGLKSLVFAVQYIDAAHRRAERVGLAPAPINAGDGYRSFRAGAGATHGVRLFFIERAGAPAPAQGEVRGVDHIVIRTPDPERAAALYGARLGLDMRLDRDVAGRRLMFFRCGNAVLEIISDASLGQDALWGLSWRVADAGAAHARLAASGFDVSDVRPGLKPGTKVFSVRNRTCETPTLALESAPRPA